MADQPVIHSTFVIERRYSKSPEQVFAAFSDVEKKKRWFAVGEHHDIEAFEMDFRVGGAERLRYRFNEKSPFPGVPLVSEGTYLDIIPNRRIVSASSMAMGEHRFSSSLLTIEVVGVEGGTDLICTHQGAFFERADGPEMREAGWKKLLDNLGQALA
ncbi:MAG: SRPBCC family protein [Acidobacteria bacterium]|nr:SRPBCC family protein [Acidobacteriota bacterium]